MANDDIVEVNPPPPASGISVVTPMPKQNSANESRAQAVAALTATALARAGTLELTPDESKALQADFGDEDFQTGAGGKQDLIYIEHAALRDRMNTVLGLGQWAIIVRDTWREEKGNAVSVYVRAMLIVRGAYVAEAVGDMAYYTNNAAQNYGDAFEGAKTAAFRRCAKEFGIGLQAWRKEWCKGWWQRKKSGKPATAPRPGGWTQESDPVAGDPAFDVITMGKYNGKPWSEIPTEYLDWLINKSEKAGPELRDRAKEEVNKRLAASEQTNIGPARGDTRETVEQLENDVPF
jgi:hypothetical protein